MKILCKKVIKIVYKICGISTKLVSLQAIPTCSVVFLPGEVGIMYRIIEEKTA